MTLHAKNYVLAPSHLPHVDNCEASHVYTAKRPKPSAANWHGIAVHLFLEKVQKYGRAAALTYIEKRFPRMGETFKRIDTNAIPQGDPEVQYLLDTERSQAYRGEWTEADPEQHITARADLVLDFTRSDLFAVFSGTPHWVVDYKTGKSAFDISAANSQMATLATARYLELGDGRARVGTAIAAITRTGAVKWPSVHVWDPQQLEVSLLHLRRTHLRVLETRAEWRDEGVEPKFNAGAWCASCSAREECDTSKAQQVIDHAQHTEYPRVRRT